MQSVRRALALLELVAAADEPIRAKPLAETCGLSLPTAHHLLSTLVSAGYLQKHERAYSLAPKIAELNRAFERKHLPGPALRAALYRVAEETGETACLCRWQQDDVVIIAVAEGSRAVRVAGIPVGLRGNAHARASGKALLAFGPSARRETYLCRSLAKVTPNTIVDPKKLELELARVRRLGYACDREEFMVGVSCVAFPVIDASGASTSLAVNMPADRFAEEFDTVRAVLQEQTQSVSALVSPVAAAGGLL